MFLVGRLPGNRHGRRVRRLLVHALGEHPYLCVEHADNARPENIRPLIDLAFVTLFDVSRSRDVGAFLDLGYALGQRKYCVLLEGPRRVDTAGFPGDDRVEFATLSELRRGVEASVVRWVGGAIRKYTAEGAVFANMDARLLAALGDGLVDGDLDDEYTTGSLHGFSEEQVTTTMRILENLGMAQATDSGWTITPLGRARLPLLIDEMR